MFEKSKCIIFMSKNNLSSKRTQMTSYNRVQYVNMIMHKY